MTAVGKKLHHFIPRFYLNAWANESKVWCFQRCAIFQANLRNVGAENHFYRLRELSLSDVEFIREAVIRDSPSRLIPMHERLLEQFRVPHATRAQYQGRPVSPDHLKAIERDIAEANENFHASIEESFQPYLARLRNGDLGFLTKDEDAVLFYRGLAVQYMRTNHRRRIELHTMQESRARYERTANIVTHILALNLGYSLFNDHPKLTISLVQNQSGEPFVTADQPIINIAARFRDAGAPATFEAYYPVSPTRALLILQPDSEFLPRKSSITLVEAHLWNLRIASRAYKQIYARSSQELEGLKKDLPAFVESL